MLPKIVVTNRVHDEVLEFLGHRSTLDAFKRKWAAKYEK